ncbi:MAG: amidohydrolase [Alphaproteobacteria bacterium]|nr:amidohydrolase [Alphaproteobacteria bacterium]
MSLPVKIDSTSNGEYAPRPIGATLRRANELAAARITEHARRTGRSRRGFLAGLCGAATTLWTLNQAFAARGNTGGFFTILREGLFESEAAAQTLAGAEFIIDAQTHLVEPNGPWRTGVSRGWEATLRSWPQGACGEADPVACYSADHFLKEVFLDSDTAVGVLSFVPSPPQDNPLSMAEAMRARELVARLDGTDRLLLQFKVMPNYPPFAAQLDAMDAAAAAWPVAAWKAYTGYGPGGRGWRLDDPRIGIPFLERARKLGVRTICIHKGLPFGGQDPAFATCDDVGPAAKLFPDINFVLYHSGYETAVREQAYEPLGDARTNRRGIDTLVRSLQAAGVPPNRNVYAELGSTWRNLMRDPTAAAHALGKLLTYVGEDNVLWGTDSIWYGSPQDQIQAFRAFEIAPALAELNRYPQLTAERKAKVFGLNAARLWSIDVAAMQKRAESDVIGVSKHAYAETRAPSFETYGPRTPAEFARLRRMTGPGPD